MIEFIRMSFRGQMKLTNRLNFNKQQVTLVATTHHHPSIIIIIMSVYLHSDKEHAPSNVYKEKPQGYGKSDDDDGWEVMMRE